MSSTDDVSRIHSKYSVTLLTPSSKIHSLIYSLIAGAAFAVVASFSFVPDADVVLNVGVMLAVLSVTPLLDSRLFKNKEYSKALHLSLYSNILWLIATFSILGSFAVLSREASAAYLGIGIFVVASFRLGLLTTVLGSSVRRAWAICLIQPMAVFLAAVPPEMWAPILAAPSVLGFGVAFLGLATAWSMLTDRAGRPNLKSTHGLVQAYLSSKKDTDAMESIFEEHSDVSKVSTAQVRLKAGGGSQDVRLVVPEIHPGPFHPIGGSNIPFRIYEKLDSSAMVMHGISDHTLNLPSGKEVENYLKHVSAMPTAEEGASCTEPVTVQINRGRVMGIRFGKNAMLFLSLSPYGMEDLPSSIKTEIESYSRNRNFERVMIVDCHNAMGREISAGDMSDMLKAARSCLDELVTKTDRQFEFGYANSSGMSISAADLALGGLGVLCLVIGGTRYFIGWADSNNMENGVREFAVERLAQAGYNLLEISTSDTHFSHGPVRTKQGYYQFGAVTPKEEIAGWYLDLARRASSNVEAGSFEILENRTNLKVMGPKVFEHFSDAMDNSLRLSKMFMIAGVSLFIASLLL